MATFQYKARVNMGSEIVVRAKDEANIGEFLIALKSQHGTDTDKIVEIRAEGSSENLLKSDKAPKDKVILLYT